MTVENILTERQNTHGDYKEVAEMAQLFRKLMRKTVGWTDMNDAQREALDSMATKFGRLGSGNPHFRDHWDDLAGYATLASMNCDSNNCTVQQDIAKVVGQIKVGGDPTGVDEDGDRFPEVVTLPKVGGKKGFFGAKKDEGEA
jgi:hypothetical protein